ncbi:hypothetical protein CAAN1_04S06458 [[Candida] anglica]|uniref:DUF1776-domain-containing protein n=1 Tax=[Candida] anglica TaxID=148631 RepID=A0ABP0ECV2_9ASCO
MVAEPVQATVETLSNLYNYASHLVATQKDNIESSDYIEKIRGWNPISTSSKQPDSFPKIHKSSIFHSLGTNSTKKIIISGTLFTIGIGFTSYYGYKWWLNGQKPISTVQNKRRVPKLSNGARSDVVLVVGSPTEPLTRLIALDFEKRGFIVYLTILDEKDLKYVESNPITDDINYLNLNDSYSFEIQLAKFQNYLSIPVVPFQGAAPHTLKLVGVVFAPSLYFPLGPIENVTVASWNKVLERIQIPLKLFSSGLINLVRTQQSKIILISSHMTSSLDLPYHSAETLHQKSIESLFTSLTREVAHQNISVTQVKLGNLNITNQRVSPESRKSNIINSEIRSWSEEMRELYATNFSKSQFKFNPMRTSRRGANLRDLYHQLYDLIYPINQSQRNPATVYCGTGARTYDWVSKVLPEYVITWLLS